VRRVVFLGGGSYFWTTAFEEIPYWGRGGGLLGNGLVVPCLGGLRIAYAVDWVVYFNGLTCCGSTHLFG
jgi:hypothetical protein